MERLDEKQYRIKEIRDHHCKAMKGDCSSCEADKFGICDISPSKWTEEEMGILIKFFKKKGYIGNDVIL